MKRGILAH